MTRRQSLDRTAATVERGHRQLSLFTRREVKQISLSRWQQIQRRLRRERAEQSAAKGDNDG